MKSATSFPDLAEELVVTPAPGSSPLAPVQTGPRPGARTSPPLPQRVAQLLLQEDDLGAGSPGRRRRTSSAAALPAESARGIRAAFAELDTERSGALDAQALQLYCLSLGLGPISVQEAAALHADICGGSAALEADLFTTLVLARTTNAAQAQQAGPAGAELDAAFALFDADGDGAVSALDFDAVLRRVRVKPPHLQATPSCLTEGRLSRADFAALLSHGPPAQRRVT